MSSSDLQTPDVSTGCRVEVRLLATKSGGRRGPPPVDFRVAFLGEGSAFDCRLRFTAAPEPGGAAEEAQLWLLDPNGPARELLKPGHVLTLWEGRAIGSAVVLG